MLLATTKFQRYAVCFVKRGGVARDGANWWNAIVELANVQIFATIASRAERFLTSAVGTIATAVPEAAETPIETADYTAGLPTVFTVKRFGEYH